MALKFIVPRKQIINSISFIPYTKLCRHLHSPICYDKEDPAPVFFNNKVQTVLKTLTRKDISKVLKKRKLGEQKLQAPEYKFMTDAELKAAFENASQKADEYLQMPPIVAMRKPIQRILSKDPALTGLDTCSYVITDITFGVADSDRAISIRHPDGTLAEAEWTVRDRMNQVYFPKSHRSLRVPSMFQDENLEDILRREEYEFILDCACAQFEPNSLEYQKITSIVYQDVNEKHKFDALRSTRHFGNLVFFLVWHKTVDNFLLDLIETCHIEDAKNLITLYNLVHKTTVEGEGNKELLDDFINKYCVKKASLKLAVQAFEEFEKQKEDLELGIKKAHGQG